MPWSCPRIVTLWDKITDWRQRILDLIIPLDPWLFLLNRPIPGLATVELKLVAHFATATRCEIAALWKYEIRNRIWFVCQMENLTSLVNDTGENVLKVWMPWLAQTDIPGAEMSTILI
ncbi:hypothetical protein FKM82_027554 [Ascaphus truei]